jgi:hypothetical protein
MAVQMLILARSCWASLYDYNRRLAVNISIPAANVHQAWFAPRVHKTERNWAPSTSPFPKFNKPWTESHNSHPSRHWLACVAHMGSAGVTISAARMLKKSTPRGLEANKRERYLASVPEKHHHASQLDYELRLRESNGDHFQECWLAQAVREWRLCHPRSISSTKTSRGQRWRGNGGNAFVQADDIAYTMEQKSKELELAGFVNYGAIRLSRGWSGNPLRLVWECFELKCKSNGGKNPWAMSMENCGVLSRGAKIWVTIWQRFASSRLNGRGS